MTNPDMIANLIADEVDRVWQSGAAFGEEQPFVDFPAGIRLLRLRFLVAVADRLFDQSDDVRNLLDAMLVVETFLSPVSGPPSDAVESAAETILNIAQNFYDEFRTE